ncbi:hypothetical protein [Streptomyces sp. CS62]|uniref:hypothetical protein n=1 Tax=Streptomyces sp. CS62 TaxID=3119268 RepID=UPI002F94F864
MLEHISTSVLRHLPPKLPEASEIRDFSSPLGSTTKRSLMPVAFLAVLPTSAATTRGLVEMIEAHSMPSDSLYEDVGAPVAGSRVWAWRVWFGERPHLRMTARASPPA